MELFLRPLPSLYETIRMLLHIQLSSLRHRRHANDKPICHIVYNVRSRQSGEYYQKRYGQSESNAPSDSQGNDHLRRGWQRPDVLNRFRTFISLRISLRIPGNLPSFDIDHGNSSLLCIDQTPFSFDLISGE